MTPKPRPVDPLFNVGKREFKLPRASFTLPIVRFKPRPKPSKSTPE